MGRIPKVEKEKALEVFHQEGADYNKLELKVEQTGSGSYDFQLNPKENIKDGVSQQPNIAQVDSQSLSQNVVGSVFVTDAHCSSSTVTKEMDFHGYKYSAEACYPANLAGQSSDHKMHDSSYGMHYQSQNDRPSYRNSHMPPESAISLFDEDLLKCDNPAQMPLKQENISDGYPGWAGQPAVSQDCALPSTFHDSFKDTHFLSAGKSNAPGSVYHKTETGVFDYHMSQREMTIHKPNKEIYNFPSQPHSNSQSIFDSLKPMFAQDSLAFNSPISDLPMFETNNHQTNRNSFPSSFHVESGKDNAVIHEHMHQSKKHSSVIHNHSSTSHIPENPFFKNTTMINDLHAGHHNTNEHVDSFEKFSSWRDASSFTSDRSSENMYNNQLPHTSQHDMISPQKLGLSLPNIKTYQGQTCSSVPSSPDIRSCATPSSITSHEGSSASQPGRYNPVLLKLFIEQVLESNQGNDIIEKLKVKLHESDINQEAAHKLLKLVKQVATRRRSSADDSSIESGSCVLNNSSLLMIPEDKSEALARFLKDVQDSAVSPTNQSVISGTSSDSRSKHKRTISEAGLYQSFENLDMKKSAMSLSGSLSSKRTSVKTLGSFRSDSHEPVSACTEVTGADSSNNLVSSTESEEEEDANIQMLKVLHDGLNLGVKILFRYKPEHREKRKLYHSGKVTSVSISKSNVLDTML